MITLDELTGAVQYKLAAGGVGEALIISRVQYSRPEDMHYPLRYRTALNMTGHTVSFSEASVERGDVWQHPADSSALRTAIAACYRIASGG